MECPRANRLFACRLQLSFRAFATPKRLRPRRREPAASDGPTRTAAGALLLARSDSDSTSRSRPERAGDAARPEDCHPGRALLRDPGPRNAGEGSVLGPGSPKLRTRNFSGRDDKRWNAHAPTDSLLVACGSRSGPSPRRSGFGRSGSRPAAPAPAREASDGPTRTATGALLLARSTPVPGAGRYARVMQRDRRIVIPGEPTCETRDPELSRDKSPGSRLSKIAHAQFLRPG